MGGIGRVLFKVVLVPDLDGRVAVVNSALLVDLGREPKRQVCAVHFGFHFAEVVLDLDRVVVGLALAVLDNHDPIDAGLFAAHHELFRCQAEHVVVLKVAPYPVRPQVARNVEPVLYMDLAKARDIDIALIQLYKKRRKEQDREIKFDCSNKPFFFLAYLLGCPYAKAAQLLILGLDEEFDLVGLVSIHTLDQLLHSNVDADRTQSAVRARARVGELLDKDIVAPAHGKNVSLA